VAGHEELTIATRAFDFVAFVLVVELPSLILSDVKVAAAVRTFRLLVVKEVRLIACG